MPNSTFSDGRIHEIAFLLGKSAIRKQNPNISIETCVQLVRACLDIEIPLDETEQYAEAILGRIIKEMIASASEAVLTERAKHLSPPKPPTE